MDLSIPRDIAKLFPNSKITILRHRLNIADIDSDIEKYKISTLRIIPFESITAISKLIQGDLKSFAESHIESHVCTDLSTLCRDYPYRIKYSIHVDNGISIYSECVDIEILMTIIFGDLIKYFNFYEGKRDDIAFKYCNIPQSFLSYKIQNILSSIAGFSKINIESKIGYAVLENLYRLSNDINELILIAPCLDSQTFETIENLAKVMLRNPLARVFILVSAPSIYDAKICRSSYREFFTNYVKLIELRENLDRLYVCNSEAASIELIANRSTYLISYDPRISDRSEFVAIKDYSYIDSFTLKYLRDCLCTTHIIRNHKHLS